MESIDTIMINSYDDDADFDNEMGEFSGAKSAYEGYAKKDLSLDLHVIKDPRPVYELDPSYDTTKMYVENNTLNLYNYSGKLGISPSMMLFVCDEFSRIKGETASRGIIDIPGTIDLVLNPLAPRKLGLYSQQFIRINKHMMMNESGIMSNIGSTYEELYADFVKKYSSVLGVPKLSENESQCVADFDGAGVRKIWAQDICKEYNILFISSDGPINIFTPAMYRRIFGITKGQYKRLKRGYAKKCLEIKLEDSINKENFEMAAKIRDRIAAFKGTIL